MSTVHLGVRALAAHSGEGRAAGRVPTAVKATLGGPEREGGSQKYRSLGAIVDSKVSDLSLFALRIAWHDRGMTPNELAPKETTRARDACAPRALKHR
jgi:hypothetical protein